MLEGLVILIATIAISIALYREATRCNFPEMKPEDTHDIDMVEHEHYWRGYDGVPR
jgi:hypothetical protein